MASGGASAPPGEAAVGLWIYRLCDGCWLTAKGRSCIPVRPGWHRRCGPWRTPARRWTATTTAPPATTSAPPARCRTPSTRPAASTTPAPSSTTPPTATTTRRKGWPRRFASPHFNRWEVPRAPSPTGRLETYSSVVYAQYYAAYQGLQALNSLPTPVRQAAYPVHPILIASGAGGLALDVGVDIVKNAVLGNGESPQDEGIAAPILGNGLKRHGIDIGSTYLPGVHNDHGQAQVDWQW
jgi:hypothetical protein